MAATMSPLPPSTDSPPPPAQASSSSSASAAAPASGVNYTILPAAELAAAQDASWPYRDGRIRNPVPSKLKGKTDGSKGNFSVMQIEVPGTRDSTDRDAEAKRTSESTELAAKRAFENGYVSLRRSRFVHLPDEPAAPPFVPRPPPAPVPTQSQRRTPLSPEETKSEQARLLTLLRSLHPALVVDQICKALAFFGGIPGAPPPANGGFPESAEANGPGSIFVGWIAEIFPKLGGNSAPQDSDPARHLDNPQPAVKRKRGRPKGSKATKARKDKGVTKGPKPPSSANESRVGTDGSAAGATDQVTANVMLLAQATSPTNPPQTPSQAPNGAARTALPGVPTPGGGSTVGTSSGRKRGRPKGSKNRPKDSAAKSMRKTGGTPQAGAQLPGGPQLPAQVPQTPQPAPSGPAAPHSFTAVNSVASVPTMESAGSARGPAINQQRQPQISSQAPPAAEQQEGTGSLAPSNSNPAPTQVQPPVYQASHTIQEPQAQALKPAVPLDASPSGSRSSKNAGQKRKRKGLDDRDAARPQSTDGRNGLAPLPDANSGTLAAAQSNAAAPPPSAAASEPPPKRQRKGLPARKGNEATRQSAGKAHAGAVLEPVSSGSVSNANPKADQIPPAAAHDSEPALAPVSVVEPSVPPSHSSQQAHFEVQSPAMDSLEAQLQAEFDQQTEVEPQTVGSQGALDSIQLAAGNWSPQQPKQHYAQQHPQQQQRRQQQQQRSSVGQSRSPNRQPQPTQPRTVSSPSVTQQQAKVSPGHPNQYRASSSQFQQQQPQQQHQHQQQQHQYQQQQHQHQQQQQRLQHQPHQQQQQQQQRSQLSGGQQHQSPQVPSGQQYSTSTPPQQQDGTSQQQSYTLSQQQYSGVQHLSSQQRYQPQLGSAPAATTSYTAQQSPQFGTPSNTSFDSNTGTYRSPATALSNSPYGQRSQSGGALFRSTSTHGLPQHSPQFGTGTAGLQQRSASASQPSSQSMQGLTNVQAFTGNAAADWSLFDTTHLDTSGQQGQLGGLSNANYGIGAAANVRSSSGTGSAFAATGLASFDSSGLGNSERYYGAGRR